MEELGKKLPEMMLANNRNTPKEKMEHRESGQMNNPRNKNER